MCRWPLEAGRLALAGGEIVMAREPRWLRARLLAAATVAALLGSTAFGTAAAGAAPGAPATPAPASGVAFELTLLHNNDGESQLVSAPGQPDFGGVARFKSVVDQLKAQALAVPPGPDRGVKRGVVMISSGDNYLAGARFQASLEKGVPFYDSIALKAIGYDALAIGNHEFDFGPDVLADFIDGFDGTATFLSANLDVSAEPRLAALQAKGTLASSKVIKVRGEDLGIIGATTPRLPSISSPRKVAVDEDVAGAVQDEVDRLTGRGVDKIVLISHLQSIQEDQALLGRLTGVDVVVAGGGDELLANPGTLLVPGDVVGVPTYPVNARDASGATVPVVTTAGDYKYVGRLVVGFDKQGRVVDVDSSSGPVRVSGVAPDAVAPEPFLQSDVVEPVSEYEAALALNVLASSEVALDGRRSPGVRDRETNLGDLMADALLNVAMTRAAAFGVDVPQVALLNGGGIRNNSLIPARRLTEKDTYDIAAFANFVSVVEDVPRAVIKQTLENAVSKFPVADGRFAQVAGLRFEYDATRTAQVTASDGTITTAGDRVRRVVLDDGTVLVDDFAVVPGSAIDVATIDFLARPPGGDQYPFAAAGLPFTTLGITYQQALVEQLTEVLGGVVTAAAYPEGGEGRIVGLG